MDSTYNLADEEQYQALESLVRSYKEKYGCAPSHKTMLVIANTIRNQWDIWRTRDKDALLLAVLRYDVTGMGRY